MSRLTFQAAMFGISVWGYSGDELSNFIFDRPSLSKTYNFTGDPYPLLYKYLRIPDVYRLFQLMAVDTIVLHKDTLPGPGYQEDFNGARAMLVQMEHVSLEKSLEEVDIYHLDSKIPVKWAYLSNRVFQVSSISDGLDLVVKNKSFVLNSDTFITTNLIPEVPQLALPQYSVTKLSPVHYILNIHGAQSPYVLVLSVNYHDSWVSEIGSTKLVNHFPINGFANGWLVDKKGDYTININFKVWPWD